MRRAARVDDNHATIVAALRRVGASVQSLASVGNGVPDLVCGYHGRDYWMEVKDGSKSPSRKALTALESDWIARWRGSKVHVVESVEQALAVIGVTR